MVRVSFLDIFKNFLILIPWVRNKAKQRHKTGILNNKKMVDARVSELSDIAHSRLAKNISIVEIGPGQTNETIVNFLKKINVSKAYVVDITRYFPDNFWLNFGVEFLYKDTRILQECSVDFIYCYDVLEHVKDPHVFLRELRRIIASSGVIFLSWDLRDHLRLNNESDWFDMHKYSKIVWNWQMSNRSSYVNRLTFGDWIREFELSGFEVTIIETIESDIASSSFKKQYGFEVDPIYRIKALLTPVQNI